MAKFQWSSEHEVFLPEVDAEHRALFLAAEELGRMVAGDVEDARLFATVRNVMTAVEGHFLHEERLMRDSRYQSLDWHTKQHDTVRRRAKGLVKQGTREAVAELGGFLCGWLLDHVGVADRLMAAHLRNWRRMAA